MFYIITGFYWVPDMYQALNKTGVLWEINQNIWVIHRYKRFPGELLKIWMPRPYPILIKSESVGLHPSVVFFFLTVQMIPAHRHVWEPAAPNVLLRVECAYKLPRSLVEIEVPILWVLGEAQDSNELPGDAQHAGWSTHHIWVLRVQSCWRHLGCLQHNSKPAPAD